MSSVTSGLADDLSETILNSNDIYTVREGIPAFLLMVDSFLRSSPDNADLLIAASSLNGAFTLFTTGVRSEILTTKSLGYASRAACIRNKTLCDFRSIEYVEYTTIVDALEIQDVAVAYAVGVAWTNWVQAHSSDYSAIGQIGRVKYLLEKVILLDERFDNGGAHLYMGGLETFLPPALGGRFDKGRVHFEKAIKFSGGDFLIAKVTFAELYAKQSYNKELHDRLLNEVLAADPNVSGLVLANTVAQQQAKELLAESDDYF